MYKVALCGKANTGKNTAATIIINRLKASNSMVRGKTMAFADPIKHMVRTMFPKLQKKYLFGPSHFRSKVIPDAFDSNGNPLTIRQALIDLGTGVGRAYNPQVWLNTFWHKFNQYKSNYNLIIVTDVRFKNEFDFLKEKGFILVRIKRNTDNNIQHASETNQDGINDFEFDYVLDNNNSLEELEFQITSGVLPILKEKQSL